MQGAWTYQLSKLAQHILGRRAREEHKVDDTTFADPVCTCGGFIILDVHKGLRWIEPKRADGCCRCVAQYNWNAAVQGHGLVKFVIEHVEGVPARVHRASNVY